MFGFRGGFFSWIFPGHFPWKKKPKKTTEKSTLTKNPLRETALTNYLIPSPNRILAFARPKWAKMVHFGPFGSANRTLANPSRTLDLSSGFLNPRSWL